MRVVSPELLWECTDEQICRQNIIQGWFKNYYTTMQLLDICAKDVFLNFFAWQGVIRGQNKAWLKFPPEKPCLVQTDRFGHIMYVIISEGPLWEYFETLQTKCDAQLD